ncbi:MAG: fibronectin type III domain-containing protein [Candidatus Brocadiaceae bacterium]
MKKRIMRFAAPLVFLICTTLLQNLFAEQWSTNQDNIAKTAVDTWKTETVVSLSNNLYLSSRTIATDSDGRPHIVYCKDSRLYHAYHDGTQWQYEKVDESTFVDRGASIAVDTFNNVHISYYDTTNADLWYAVKKSGKWLTEKVDDTVLITGSLSSIAVDKDGNPHIGYCVFDFVSKGGIRYAKKVSGKWSTEPVDGGWNSLAQSVCLGVDGDGKAHISYLDGANYDVKYATNVTGTWEKEIVDGNGFVALQSSIAVDKNGKAYIIYTNSSIFDIKYATNASGSWVTEKVFGGAIATFLSIAVDGNSKSHVSYYAVGSDGGGDLVYANNTGNAWIAETVDSIGNVGLYSSIAVDASNNVHIDYYDVTQSILKHATKTTDAVTQPTVKTGKATKVTVGSAVLNGTANAQGATTKVWFEYGTTIGVYKKKSINKMVNGKINKKISASIKKLSPGTKYYYRIAAQNKAGTSYGSEKSFSTK